MLLSFVISLVLSHCFCLSLSLSHVTAHRSVPLATPDMTRILLQFDTYKGVKSFDSSTTSPHRDMNTFRCHFCRYVNFIPMILGKPARVSSSKQDTSKEAMVIMFVDVDGDHSDDMIYLACVAVVGSRTTSVVL